MTDEECIDSEENRQKIFWTLFDYYYYYYYDSSDVFEMYTLDEYEKHCENKFPLLKKIQGISLHVFRDTVTLAEALYSYANKEQLKYIGWVMPDAYGHGVKTLKEHQKNIKMLKEYYRKNRQHAV